MFSVRLVLVCVSTLFATAVLAHGGDTTLIHACVNASSGTLKLVSPDQECEKNWNPVDWGIQGPPGPADPALLGRISAIENQLTAIQTELSKLTDQLALPEMFIENVAVTEGDALITISLSKPYTSIVTMSYETVDVTAISSANPRDYISVSGALTFLPGEVIKTVTVQGYDDAIPEQDETYLFRVTGVANAIASGDDVIVTLLNDDFPTISLNVQPYYLSPLSNDGAFGHPVREGDSVEVEVMMSSPAEFPVLVEYTYSGDTATENEDFLPVTGQIEFVPGEHVKTLIVQTIDDSVAEGDERMNVQLTGVQGGVLAPQASAVQISILHSDVEFSIEDMVATEGDAVGPFAIHISKPLTTPIHLFPEFISVTALLENDVRLGGAGNQFNLNCIEGSPLYNCDSSPNIRIEIPAGEPTVTYNVRIIDDNLVEGDETFLLKLIDYSATSVSGQSTAKGTIIDND